MMKKRALLALLMAVLMLLTGSCSLIVKDPEVDKQTVVLEVNGETFLKGQVQSMIREEMEYQQYMYQYQYGVALDSNDPEVAAYVQDTVIQNLIRQAVVDQKLEKEGYTALTEEEKQAALESAQAQYDSYVEEVLEYNLAASELTGDELRAEAERILTEEQGVTLEDLIADSELIVADEKLYQSVVADVAVTEEEILAAYNERVETAKADYEYDLQYYDMDRADGTTIYYHPAGYRYVKHILLSFTEEEESAIAALEDRVAAAQEELSRLQVQNGEETAEDEAFAEAHQAAEAALVAAQQELDTAREAAYAALQPKVEEVTAALEAGEDFDALIEKYGQDPGMKVEPAKQEGYVVGAGSVNYVDSFREGAMALAAVGDVSEPVRSEYGLHLIKYVADVNEGPVAYEDLKDELASSVLEEKKNQVYSDAVSAWVEAADVKIYQNRLED